MKTILLILSIVTLVGCSGEPAPVVGDAAISKGIASQPMPKPPHDAVTSGLTSRDVSQMRSR